MKKVRLSDPEQVRLLADTMGHPLRGKLLFAATEKTGCGAKELAERIGEPIGKVRYHLRALVKLGLIEVEEEATRRGVIEHRYRALVDPEIGLAEDLHLSDEQRQKLTLEIIKSVFRDATDSIESGVMWARRERVVGRDWGEVDVRGWRELTEIHGRVLREVRSVIEQSDERLQSSGESPIKVCSANLIFESSGDS